MEGSRFCCVSNDRGGPELATRCRFRKSAISVFEKSQLHLNPGHPGNLSAIAWFRKVSRLRSQLGFPVVGLFAICPSPVKSAYSLLGSCNPGLISVFWPPAIIQRPPVFTRKYVSRAFVPEIRVPLGSTKLPTV